jgi:protein CpxP
MRYLMFVVVAIAFVAVCSQPARAQRMQMTAEQRTQRLKDSLNLSEDQTASVLKIYQEMDQQRKELFSSDSSDRESRMQAMRSMMEKTDEKIEALLTPEQKTKYDVMKQQRQQRPQRSRTD